ncbi:MAG: NAD(P)-dependent oxidoreductase [Clostridiaceae bacterium]|nr:NAD(P)-dependent oxidoreductase [Clostridiaceae bacterium]
MKHILILGSTGFVGKNLKEYLEQQKRYHILCPTHHELDLLCEQEVAEYLSSHSIDVIFHCAIFSPKSAIDEQEALQKDLQMYLHLEKHRDKYRKMIYLGSGAEYDKTAPIVVAKETDLRNQIPKTQYGMAKYVIGRMIENSSNIYNFRIWGLFGKYEDWQTTFISNCCCKAIKKYPLSIRRDTCFDYLWIDDFCRIAEWAIEHELMYHTYNVGSNRRIFLSQIAMLIQKISHADSDIIICQEGYGNEYTADSTRLLQEYGKDYATPIEDAIKEVYTWYQNRLEIIDMRTLIYGKE